MNVRQLEAFKTIMGLGSFTRAAERMNLSQPGISKLIYLLERKCGFSLFHRLKNGVIPTSEGEMLRRRTSPSRPSRTACPCPQ